MQSQDVFNDNSRYILQVYVGALSLHYEALSVEASKQTTAEEIVSCIVERLSLSGNSYELAEVAGECKERRLSPDEKPVSVMLLWPMHSDRDFHRFYLRETQSDITWLDSYGLDSHIFRDFIPFLLQPENREYPDLCQLPDLNETSLLENLRQRFEAGYIYTYVGSILIAVNPFKFYPIYNPKYVRLYQNQRIGPILPPHIFAIADNAYYSMLKEKKNQCIVISGESGSGKTESTNFLLHHLTALSQKGSHGSGVEQTILSAGPVLEAFGNAKTAHNNNSSRFGKFIQVNYRENGMVQGAVVQKYLLEKSRIVSQGPYERNYHVFYYLLSGATDSEKNNLHLLQADKYHYLNSKNLTLENCDEKYEFSRLKQSMEMVGFSAEKQKRLFNVLSAVLLLGNVEFFPKKSTYHHDESVQVRNVEIVAIISELLKVKYDTLLAALTSKRVKASGEVLIMNYRLPEAIAARDALAKCLYGALFDWIVLQVNHALLNKDQTPHTGHSIGVLDIFGFEDFGPQNSFEQFCINYANEHLQYYFNLHVFKYEQNEYKREGIKWRDIEFSDNSDCLLLFESKPTGLLCILDDLCCFPGATNETLLQKFNSVHRDNKFYEKPQKKENAFIIRHYAGQVKYQVAEMREKNLDLMRQDIVSVLKNSSMAFVRELVGADPVAVFRWAILRAFFRSYFAFKNAGKKHRKERYGYSINKAAPKHHIRHHNDLIISSQSKSVLNWITSVAIRTTNPKALINEIGKNKSFRPRERPKKGLKNLQTVKMMSAGTNSINQTGAKTRKQPLTVTAQFQNSLTSLMDTLNQANPYFIRCIKSNSQKIPNKFDDATVIRQLRYTGMLETVRIRRAGYNVRLTYEEFIQLYRILLPKGLLSSQKDVKDFLSTMDLNKQHYQLGTTKIYMRESQKMRLDIKLHTKIIDSIVLIQRWFRGILQRKKYKLYKSSAILIQSFWRMHLKQKLAFKQKLYENSAIIIQSNWKMYKQQKWFNNFRKNIVIFQSHVRGYLTRKLYKAIKTSIDDVKVKSDYVFEDQFPEKLIISSKNIESNKLYFDSRLCSMSNNENVHSKQILERNENIDNLNRVQNTDVLQKAGNQLRSLMISTKLDDIDDNFTKDLNKDEVKGSKNFDKSKDVEISKTLFFDDSLNIHFRYQDENLLKKRDSGSHMSFQDCFEDSRKEEYYNILSERIGGSSHRNNKFLVYNDQITIPNESIRPRPYSNVDGFPNQSYQVSNFQKNYPHELSSYAKRLQSLDENVTLTTSAVITPKGKAAAFLGSISENQNQLSSVGNKIHSSKQQIKTRRIKTNLSDDVTGANVLKYHSPKPQGINSEHMMETLKRRNSDPSTNKLSLLDTNRGNDMYQSSTHINIAGHRFRKAARIGKAEKCASCQESDAFVNEGYRCLDCKLLVHTKCIQNGGVKTLLCEAKRSKRLRKNTDKLLLSNSKYSGTREYTDSTDRIISDAKELNLMDDFITLKIYKMDENEGKKASEVDKVFKQALRAFKDNLVTQYSVAHKQNSEQLNIKYRDLINNFGQVMETCCGKNNDFPMTMGINAFRGFMNEFMNSRETDKPKAKRKKDKKRKIDEHTNFNGHNFQLTIINIPTVCEICTLFLLWPIERGLVCQNCRLTCHKKCYQKAILCNKGSTQMTGELALQNTASKLFGVSLIDLCTAEGVKIPTKIEQLITKIEMLGLYSEGIYRKSGVSSKIKELKWKMSEKSSNEIDYEFYNINVLANVLKSFLRDLPEPLLTFDRYDDFIRAADLPDVTVRVHTLLSLVKKLPPAHHALLERLIFHLALVAQREKHNRMSASSLAIVFAPCVLRTNRLLPAQDSLNDIGRQTKCIETLITQKMINVKSTLADIDTLDTAARTATTRLSSLRNSREFDQQEESRPESETEAMILLDHIQEIRKEKEILTSGLPNLVRASSDDDLLSTDLEGEGGSMDDLSAEKDKETQSFTELNENSYDLSFESLDDSNQYDNVSRVPSSYNAKTCSPHIDNKESPSSPMTFYSLRNQSIDYVMKPRHYLSLDQGNFSPNSSKANYCMRTGSQHDLRCPSQTCTIQKPMAIRSISGGHESLIHNTLPQNVVCYNPSPLNIKSKNDDKTDGSSKRKSKGSRDDEPIMV